MLTKLTVVITSQCQLNLYAVYLKHIPCCTSIISQQNKGEKNLPPLKYPLVVLFIAELIIFSQNLLLLLAAQFLLKPPLSSHAAKPEASELPDLLLSRSISWEVASFASNPPLHVLCHSSNSHYLNSRGRFSKSDKSSSSLQSPIQVVNYPCINLHKTHLHSCSPHPLKNLQQLLTAYLINVSLAWQPPRPVINRPRLTFH